MDHQEEGTKLQISLDKLKGENDALRDDNNRLNEELANLKKESGEIVSIHQQVRHNSYELMLTKRFFYRLLPILKITEKK